MPNAIFNRPILLVEDSPVDLDLTRRALARTVPEYHLEITPNLTAAMACLGKSEPGCELVLTDLRLPDGSGLELLAWIRARQLPMAVVLLTGSGDQDSAVAALKAGADDYLVKHGDYLEQLPETLNRAMAHFRKTGGGGAKALRVFYAEDNPLDVDLTRRHLARHAPHIQVEVATTGTELLGRLPENDTAALPCDILLLDFRLPDTTALKLVQTIRMERGLDLPVVLAVRAAKRWWPTPCASGWMIT